MRHAENVKGQDTYQGGSQSWSSIPQKQAKPRSYMIENSRKRNVTGNRPRPSQSDIDASEKAAKMKQIVGALDKGSADEQPKQENAQKRAEP